jgi:hypothetical protein
MKQKGLANIFVIILGVFILIILFGYFRDKKIITFKNATKETVGYSKYGPDMNYPYTGCGIQVNKPTPAMSIDNVFEFSGQATGCGWNAQNGFIGTLEILDSNNYSLTDVISVPVNIDGSFKIKAALKRQPSDDLGLVNLRSMDGLQVASFTIYLK